MPKVTEIFGCDVFNDYTMQERLPAETYKALKKTVDEGIPLDIHVANIVAKSLCLKEYTSFLYAVTFTVLSANSFVTTILVVNIV